MKSIILNFLLAFFFLMTNMAFCQDALFEVVKGNRSTKSNLVSLQLNKSILHKIKSENKIELELLVPITENESINFNFKKYELLSPHYKLVNADNQTVSFGSGLSFYHSVGNKQYNAHLTIGAHDVKLSFNSSDTQFQIIKSDVKGQYFLQEEKGSNDAVNCASLDNISFYDDGILNSHHIDKLKNNKKGNPNGIVDIFVVCDYQTYLDNNSNINATEAYATTVFNGVASVYDDFGITLRISEMKIWDHQDPYATPSGSIFHIVGNFTCEYGNGYIPGDIGHLISTQANVGGGIVTGGNDCSGAYVQLGFTKVQAGSSNINYILAHEIGHQLSSPHTHACKWNGNNTAIDGCAAVEGTCSDPGIPTNGTVMSYCGNYDLNNPFHPQVIDKIVDYVYNCMTPYVPVSCDDIKPDAFSVDILSSTSVRITVNHAGTNFLLGWRPTGTSSFTYNSPYAWHPNTFTLTGLLPNTQYEFISVVQCPGSSRSTGWTCPDNYFTTNADNCQTALSVSTYSHLRNDINGSVDYEASGIIQSNQTVNTNSVIVYDSGTNIELLKTFEVKQGSIFHAFIDGCGGL